MTRDQSGKDPRVLIVMGVHNGAQTLPAQLDSLIPQSYPHWDLAIRDDGSRDTSRAVIAAFREKARQAGHHVSLREGPGQGFSRNFMALIDDTGADVPYVALSDQDDIWRPDKVERAVKRLARLPAEVPALYCSRRIIWNPVTESRRPSRLSRRKPSFRNALIENIASGNTIVLNRAAVALIKQAGDAALDVFAHDWWLYLLVAGAGGKVVYDPQPTMLYRQHAGNILGAGESLTNSILNKVNMLRGTYADRIGRNLAALDRVEALLTDENRAVLEAFKKARKAGVLTRLSGFRKAGLYRQDPISGLGFWGAALLGKV